MKNRLNYQSGIGAVAIIVIIALLALGGGAYYYLTNEDPHDDSPEGLIENGVEENGEDVDTEADNDAEADTEKGALANTMEEFKSLFASNNAKNITCTYDFADTEVSGSAVLKIKDSKAFRTDIKAVYEGEENVSHMIGLTDTIYLWGDTDEKGVKSVVGEEELRGELEDLDSIEADGVTNFSCKRGGPSAAELKIPSNIDFFDASAMGEFNFDVE